MISYVLFVLRPVLWDCGKYTLSATVTQFIGKLSVSITRTHTQDIAKFVDAFFI